MIAQIFLASLGEGQLEEVLDDIRNTGVAATSRKYCVTRLTIQKLKNDSNIVLSKKKLNVLKTKALASHLRIERFKQGRKEWDFKESK